MLFGYINVEDSSNINVVQLVTLMLRTVVTLML